ncbi:MAG: hypothetical protein ACRDCW_02530 [Sarcina sp.]
MILRVVSTIASLELVSITRNYFVVENHSIFQANYASMRSANAIDSILNVVTFVIACVGAYLITDGIIQLHKKIKKNVDK